MWMLLSLIKIEENLQKKFGAKNLFDSEKQIIETYNYGLECSATNRGFHTLQKAINSNRAICILSDGNIEDFNINRRLLSKRIENHWF